MYRKIQIMNKISILDFYNQVNILFFDEASFNMQISPNRG